MLRWTRYAGNKAHLSKDFNKQVAKLDVDTYAEPFFEGGDIFFNLGRDFDRCVLNATDAHVAQSLRSFRDAGYNVYKKALDGVFAKFGDIRSSKKAYNGFRTWYNEKYFDGKGDATLSGLYYHMLLNACLNSLPKFGKAGFEQAWGNRSLELSEDEYEQVQKVLADRAPIITSADPSAFTERYDRKDAIFFVDGEVEILKAPGGLVKEADHLSVLEWKNI